ncbi:MAG: GNAT family N-acetyltransferase [Kofleriaceae bacterium]|nr:GNAT family N-acetyltransferase [Kofleriaceae bacterium]MBP6835876.1 GNAT family N-acetyltransferase [Kofleriaceae bacterium]MBP9203875.1 GNAT family N-acetyltransferase [Kofleriaceae bacterium]
MSAPPTPTIRAAAPADGPAMLAVHQDAVAVLCARAYSAAQLAGWFAGRTTAMYRTGIAAGWTWVALGAAGEVVGFVELDDHKIGKLFVHSTQAGRGVGPALLDHALAQLAAAGADRVTLRSTLNAVGFYRRHGFVERARAAFVSGSAPPLEVVEMERYLVTTR